MDFPDTTLMSFHFPDAVLTPNVALGGMATQSTTHEDISQWRIQDFPEEGALTPKGRVPTYYLANFSRKLHENKEIWGQRGGGRASLMPPLRSATVSYTASPFVASHANDGNNEASMTKTSGACSRTTSTRPVWWQVDLLQVYEILKVAVATDCRK